MSDPKRPAAEAIVDYEPKRDASPSNVKILSPDYPPTPAYGPTVSRPADPFPLTLAKASLAAGVFAFASPLVMLFQGVAWSSAINFALLALCHALAWCGVATGVIGLIKNNVPRFPSVSGYAITGLVVSGIALPVTLLISTLLLLKL
jgi:hypothetical protein